MSIKVMSRVWAHSQQKGGELLIMLALADFSNDEGECWPHIATLAAKARLTTRQVQKLLPRLEQAGEIRRVKSNGGRNRAHRFFIALTENGEQSSLNKVHRKRNGEQKTVNSVTGNGELEFTRIEPSGTVNKNKSSTNVLNGANAPSLSSVDNSFPEKKKSKPARRPAALEPEAFAAWYATFPRHEGREDALKAWRKLDPDPALIQTIVAATAHYAAAKADTETTFIKTPAAWLNGKRWQDELEKSEPATKRTFVNG